MLPSCSTLPPRPRWRAYGGLSATPLSDVSARTSPWCRRSTYGRATWARRWRSYGGPQPAQWASRAGIGPVATFLPASPVVYLEVRGSGEELSELDRLRDAVSKGPLDRKARWPWVPHVTLATRRHRSASAAVAGPWLLSATASFDRVVLLEETRKRAGGPWPTPCFGPPAVVGRGASQPTIVEGRLLGPDVLALLATDAMHPRSLEDLALPGRHLRAQARWPQHRWPMPRTHRPDRRDVKGELVGRGDGVAGAAGRRTGPRRGGRRAGLAPPRAWGGLLLMALDARDAPARLVDGAPCAATGRRGSTQPAGAWVQACRASPDRRAAARWPRSRTVVTVATAVTPRPDALTRDRLLIVRQHLPRNILRSVPPATWARAGVVLASVVVAAGVVGRFLAPGGLWLDEALSVNIAKLPLHSCRVHWYRTGRRRFTTCCSTTGCSLFGQGDLRRAGAFGRDLHGHPAVPVGGRPACRGTAHRLGRAAARCQLALGDLLRHRHPHVLAHGPRGSPVVPGGPRGRWSCRAGGGWSRGGGYCGPDVHPLLGPLPGGGRRVPGCCGGAWDEAPHRRAHARYASPGRSCARRCGPWSAGMRRVAAVVAGVRVPGAPHRHALGRSAGPGEPAFRVRPTLLAPGPGASCSRSSCSAWSALALFAKARPRRHERRSWRYGPSRAPGSWGCWSWGPSAWPWPSGMVTGAAFDDRYIAVVFPLFALLCALGLTTFTSRRVTARPCWLWPASPGLLSAEGAELSAPHPGRPGSCRPERCRLSPATWSSTARTSWGRPWTRLLNVPDVTQLTFPRMIGPQRVDWVNYVSTIQDTDVGTLRSSRSVPAQPGQHALAGLAQRLPGLRRELRLPGQLAADAAPGGRDGHNAESQLLRVREPGALAELKP